MQKKFLTVAGMSALAVAMLAGCGGPSLHTQEVTYLAQVSGNLQQMQNDSDGFAKAGEGLTNKTMTFKQATNLEVSSLAKVDKDITTIDAIKTPKDQKFEAFQKSMTDTLHQYDSAMHEMVGGIGDTPQTTNLSQVKDGTSKVMNLMPKLQSMDTQFNNLKSGVTK